jgi:hypothetical protein
VLGLWRGWPERQRLSLPDLGRHITLHFTCERPAPQETGARSRAEREGSKCDGFLKCRARQVQRLDIPNEAFRRCFLVRHFVEDIDMLYSGIDLHKHSLVIHTVGEDGAPVREAELATARPALTAYFATLPGPHRAVVECLGGWYWVRDLVVPQGIDLRLGHAKYLKAISYAKVKTDRVDARTLAQLLRVGLVPEAHMISPEHREVRDLLRARLKLVSRATRARHAITGLFTQYNVRTAAELPALVQLQVRLLDEEHALLAAQVKRCEREFRPRLLPRADVQRLVWIPGVGAIIA